jgi:ankyrin repeat protein
MSRAVMNDTIVLMVRSGGRTVKDLREMRLSTPQFQEVIDDRSLDVWTNVLTTNDIDTAFRKKDMYVIEKAFQSLEWYGETEDVIVYDKAGKEKIVKEPINARKINKIPDVATYKFCEKLIDYLSENSSNDVTEMDKLIVEYGYTNCTAPTIIRGKTITPFEQVIWSSGMQTRVQFYLSNGAEASIDSFRLFVKRHGDDRERFHPDVLKTIDLFLDNGLNIQDALNESGKFPFIVEHLIKEGADPNYKDSNGDTPPIHFAKQNYIEKETLQMMLDVGADFNVINKNGDNALSVNLKNISPGNPRASFFLLEHSSLIQDTIENGVKQALSKWFSYKTEMYSFVKLLLEKGASLENAFKYITNMTPAILKLLIEVMKEKGLNLLNNRDGLYSPLDLVLKETNRKYSDDYFEMAKILLQAGAIPPSWAELSGKITGTTFNPYDKSRIMNLLNEFKTPSVQRPVLVAGSAASAGTGQRSNTIDDFWNKRKLDTVELRQALKDVFGLTDNDIENIPYKGRRIEPMIKKLNELRDNLSK